MNKLKTNFKNKHLKYKIYNYLIINGNKKTCEKIFLKSLKLIQKQSLKYTKNLIKSAIVNTSPIVKLKKVKKKKKKMKEFPFILSKQNRISLAINSIIKNIAKKQKTDFSNKFTHEIILSSRNKSDSVKKKENLYEHAFINKKYANYRWF